MLQCYYETNAQCELAQVSGMSQDLMMKLRPTDNNGVLANQIVKTQEWTKWK